MYDSAEDILNYVRENDVKFIRLAFCDIFGVQKNIAIQPSELPRAFEKGISFDASAVSGFMNVEESDLLLVPDPRTLTVLPWRPDHGRVVRLFCDIRRPGGAPFEGDCRRLLRQTAARAAQKGYVCKFGPECEFYIFHLDEEGEPTDRPLDRAGYFDICLLYTSQAMVVSSPGSPSYRLLHSSTIMVEMVLADIDQSKMASEKSTIFSRCQPKLSVLPTPA